MPGCLLVVVPVCVNTLTEVILEECNYPKRRIREASWIWLSNNRLINDLQYLVFA